MYKHILCPIDGSTTSNRGMTEAIRLAKDQKAKLGFLHVVDAFLPMPDAGGGVNLADILDSLRLWGEKVLKDAQAAARAQGIEADVEMAETIGGRASKFIVEQARKWPVDIIVMGTHGHRGISHLLLGSDAEAVVRTSPVPVLLVKGAQEGMGGAT
ncbi:MAG TPA: universal stress protein [Gammaproteobacteria bacterium]|nr:universal stress protein [Gammaproteobacteria bacterium]